MAKVGTAEYDVEISRAKVAAEVAATSRQIETGLGGSARRLSAEFSNAQRAAVAGIGAFALANTLGNAVGAASDLAEQQSKVGVVFGDSAKDVQAFASTASSAIGQSERSALEAAGTFGNLFSSVGLTEQQSAQFSTTLTKLGSDLASFNNTSVDDALTALRSGLVGETEPLKRFGVNLNEATLKTKALELGLSDGAAVLDANAKAQAAYALILEQTTVAQGDFARTSDGLANQQRILAAEFENTQAKLGEELIPAAKLGVTVLGDLTTVIGTLPGPIVATGVAVGGAVVAFGLLGPVVRSGIAEISAFAAAQRAATGPIAGTTAALNAQIAASNARDMALGYGEVMTARSVSRTTRLKDAYLTAGGASGVFTKGLVAAAAGVVSYNVALGALERAVKFSGDIEELGRALAAVGAEGESTALIFNEVGGSVEGFAKSVEDAFAINSKTEAFKTFLTDLPGLVDTKQAQSDLAALDEQLATLYETDPQAAVRSFTALSQAIVDQGGSVNQLNAALPTFTDLMLDNFDASAQLEEQTKATAQGLLDQADAVREAFQSQRDVADAQRDTILAVGELDEARREARGDSDAYRDAQRAITDATQELSQAQREAAGDSDAYRNAQKSLADAERGVADAQRDTLSAQQALTDARRDAAESLDDLRRSAEGAALSEERAELRLLDAQERLEALRNKPNVSERERREAELALREADLALRDAQDSNQDTASDLQRAEAAGVEGSDAVVAAKQRVEEALRGEQDARDRVAEAANAARQVITDANVRVRESEERVSEATDAAATIIEDAKTRVDEATRNVEEAVLDQAEAEADLAEATGGATAAQDAYRESLERSAEVLDPSSPFRRNLTDYLADLREIDELNQADSIRPTESTTIGGPRDPAVTNRPTESSTLGGSDPLRGGRSVTVNVRNDANPKEIADAILWEN